MTLQLMPLLISLRGGIGGNGAEHKGTTMHNKMTKEQAEIARAYFAAVGKVLLRDLPQSREAFYPNHNPSKGD